VPRPNRPYHQRSRILALRLKEERRPARLLSRDFSFGPPAGTREYYTDTRSHTTEVRARISTQSEPAKYYRPTSTGLPRRCCQNCARDGSSICSTAVGSSHLGISKRVPKCSLQHPPQTGPNRQILFLIVPATTLSVNCSFGTVPKFYSATVSRERDSRIRIQLPRRCKVPGSASTQAHEMAVSRISFHAGARFQDQLPRRCKVSGSASTRKAGTSTRLPWSAERTALHRSGRFAPGPHRAHRQRGHYPSWSCGPPPNEHCFQAMHVCRMQTRLPFRDPSGLRWAHPLARVPQGPLHVRPDFPRR